jgi:hypothetical protein
MRKAVTVFLFYSVLMAVTIACLSLSWFVFHMGREGLIDWAVQLLQKKHLQGRIEAIYNRRSHAIIQLLCFIVPVMIGVGWFVLLRNRKKLVNRLCNFVFAGTDIVISFFKHSIPKESITRYLLLTILLFAVGRSIYYIVTIPVSFDEADTWLQFISRGPVMIASFYPFPNNHIFYNWCVWFCSFIPVNTTVLLRLPLIPALPVCIIFIYRLAKHLLNERASILSVSVFTFSFTVYHYSYTARGYLFVILFALIALWCLVMLDVQNKKRYWASLVASVALGFYSVPSFLYFAAPVLTFFFIRWAINDKAKAMILVKYATVAAILTLLLYTPVFLVSGTGALFSFYGKQFTYAELPKFIEVSLFELARHQFGRSAWHMIAGSSIVGLLLLAGLGMKKSKHWFYILSFIVCLLPVFVFFVQRQPYPPRAWVHLLIFISLIAATPGLWIQNKTVLCGIAAIVIVLRFYPGFHENHLLRNGYDVVVKQVANRMIAENRNTVYINKNYVKPLFDFYFQSQHFPATISIQKGMYRSDKFDANTKYSTIVWYTKDPNNQLLKFPYDTVLVHHDFMVLFAK